MYSRTLATSYINKRFLVRICLIFVRNFSNPREWLHFQISWASTYRSASLMVASAAVRTEHKSETLMRDEWSRSFQINKIHQDRLSFHFVLSFISFSYRRFSIIKTRNINWITANIYMGHSVNERLPPSQNSSNPN